MAKTLISELVKGDSVIMKGRAKAKKLSGKLAAQYYPGALVYMSAADTWTQTPGTGSETNYFSGIVEYPKWTSSTFGEKNIDDIISDGTARNCEIIVGPRDGTLKVAALNIGNSAAFFYGKGLIPGSGGKMDVFRVGEGDSRDVQAIVAEEGVAARDNVVACYLV